MATIHVNWSARARERASDRVSGCILGGLACVWALCTWTAASAAERRPFSVDDMFALESVPSGAQATLRVAFAPDGKAVAFTRGRVPGALTDYQARAFEWGFATEDVWVQTTPRSAPVNITRGAADASGWSYPKWSPDGERLALLSTRDGNVRLWLWERKTNSLRMLASRGVDVFNEHLGFIWLDPGHVLCSLLAEGEQSPLLRHDTQTIAPQAWAQASAGRKTTASILESGAPSTESEELRRNGPELVVIDVVTAATRMLFEGATQDWSVSPTGKTIAYCRTDGVPTPKAADDLTLFQEQNAVCSLDVLTLQGEHPLAAERAQSDVVGRSVSWSPDGRQLTFLKYGEPRRQPPALYRAALSEGDIERIALPNIDVVSAAWSGDSELLLRGGRREEAGKSRTSNRLDWWLLARDGNPRCLTCSIPNTAPSALWPASDRRSLIGVADGALWRIGFDGTAPRNLTASLDASVQSVVWPNLFVDQPRTFPRLVVVARKGQELPRYYTFDEVAGVLIDMPQPAEETDFCNYSAESGDAILSRSNDTGTYLWRSTSSANASLERILATNTFLANLTAGTFKRLSYVSLDGTPLTAWILLPAGYDPGKRYPLITWVYAGAMAAAHPPAQNRISDTYVWNMQVAAARGYAVLFPSIPLGKPGDADDPLFRLTGGVLPAVERAISENIADPARIFVMGHSFGGFSVFGLVTQTNRFKAAVAAAGFSDLVSYYSTLDSRIRYLDAPYISHMSWLEAGNGRMGNPPWKDLDRYRRNSPITYVDRVQAPLMIVHGDMDFVPITQAEEFYGSLFRQGKRAQFVRYWGEEHVLHSPANIRDVWNRIFSWFDDFGDIYRDPTGQLVFDQDDPSRVRSRAGKPALTPDAFAHFVRSTH